MKQRWPWMRNKWIMHDNRSYSEVHDTLREAKQRAQELWPGCGFKSSTQFRKEYEREQAQLEKSAKMPR